MTVNSHLTSLVSNLVLKGSEETSINTSISTINTRITNYFGTNVTNHFKFGSSTRGTILPRKADENSDIDYMVVFSTANGTYKPQTYLDRLRRFAEKYYSTSEIHQSHPTIVLELNHIKFELVPAILDFLIRYQIPSPASDWSDWLVTDPNGFNSRLTTANTNNNYKIKPLVRLIKYWNALNGHHFSSYDLENYIVSQGFWGCSGLDDYFYMFWDNFSCSYDTAQYIKDKVARAKEKVSIARQLEQQGYSNLAEQQIASLLPSI